MPPKSSRRLEGSQSTVIDVDADSNSSIEVDADVQVSTPSAKRTTKGGAMKRTREREVREEAPLAAGNVTARAFVAVGLARRGVAWAVPPSPLIPRIFVAKGRGMGDQVSPFKLMVPLSLALAPIASNTSVQSRFPRGRVPLELWWQGAKMMKSESEASYVTRAMKIYREGVVQRRYFNFRKFGVECALLAGGPDGSPTRFDYLDSRYAYCKAYAIAVKTTPAYAELRKLSAPGMPGVLLVGPDGHPLDNTTGDLVGSLDAAYQDVSVQFGHERVLFAMLACEVAGLGPESYPWERHAHGRHLKQLVDHPYEGGWSFS